MKKIFIPLLFILIPGITFAYSGELEIQKLVFQVEQLDNFQNKYINLIYFIVGTIFTLFGGVIILNWFQSYKLGVKEIENLKNEIKNYNLKFVEKQKIENKNYITNAVKNSNSTIETKLYEIKRKFPRNTIYEILSQLEDDLKYNEYYIDNTLEELKTVLDKNEYDYEDKLEVKRVLEILISNLNESNELFRMDINTCKSIIKDLGITN